MYKAAVRKMIRHTVERLNQGDYQPALKMFAADATLAFPGDNSWSNQFRTPQPGCGPYFSHRGLPELEAFLQRYVSHGLQMAVDDILVNGPPWNTRAAARVRDWVLDADGAADLREPSGAVRHRALGQDPFAGGLRRHHPSRGIRRATRHRRRRRARARRRPRRPARRPPGSSTHA